jgi:predicted nucleic acid-binding protein
MTVLLDTNIIMDALQGRQPFDAEAKEILSRAQNGGITCLFTANAAADIFYLYSKARDTKSAKTALDFLLKHYGVVSVTHEDCVSALSLSIDDFEDALVAVCANKAKADYIITRDEKFLQSSSQVKAVTPKEFVALPDRNGLQ